MRRTLPTILATLLLSACGRGDGGTGPDADDTFGLQLSHAELTVEAGGLRSIGAELSRRDGFESLVTIRATGAPVGVWIEPVMIEKERGIMVVVVPAGTPPGRYPLSITASAAGVAPRRTELVLAIEPPGARGAPVAGGRVTIRVTGDEEREWTGTGGLQAEAANAPGFGSLTLISLRAGDASPAGAADAVSLNLSGVLAGRLVPGAFDIFDRTVVEPPDEPDIWVGATIGLRPAVGPGLRTYVARSGTLRITSMEGGRIAGQVVFDGVRETGVDGAVKVTVEFSDVPLAPAAP